MSVTVFENEVELSFNNGLEEGYINFETNDEGGINLNISIGDVGSEFESSSIMTTIDDKENLITFLKEAIILLEKE